jgi:hypothetical protein
LLVENIENIVTLLAIQIYWNTNSLDEDYIKHKGIEGWGTLRSRHGIHVDFDKICVFCSKCWVYIDKCVFIIIKIKCVNSGKISDICDKVNFTSKLHTFYNTWQVFY